MKLILLVLAALLSLSLCQDPSIDACPKLSLDSCLTSSTVEVSCQKCTTSAGTNVCQAKSVACSTNVVPADCGKRNGENCLSDAVANVVCQKCATATGSQVCKPAGVACDTVSPVDPIKECPLRLEQSTCTAISISGDVQCSWCPSTNAAGVCVPASVGCPNIELPPADCGKRNGDNCNSDLVADVRCQKCVSTTGVKCQSAAVPCAGTTPPSCECSNDFRAPLCPDGLTSVPSKCVSSNDKCAWVSYFEACPSCVQCLIAPCSLRNNPLAVECKTDSCHCTATCFNANNEQVECRVKDNNIPTPVDCTKEGSCNPETKPAATTICEKGTTVCTNNLEANSDVSCVWKTACPSTIPTTTCTRESCDPIKIDGKVLSDCPNGTPTEWQCRPTQLQSSVGTDGAAISFTSCEWTISPCPKPDVSVHKCFWGGACGTTCVEYNSDVSLALAPIDPTVCRSAISCEDSCSIDYRGGCEYSTTSSSCMSVPRIGYKDCIRKCQGGTIDPPTVVCSGTRPCACNIGTDACYFCQLPVVTEDGSSFTIGSCLSSSEPTACQAFGGQSLLFKPDNCDILPPIKVPPKLVAIYDRYKSLSADVLRAEIEKLIATIEVAKKFLFSIHDPSEPETDDTEVKVNVVVDIVGPEPTTGEKTELCERLFKPAASTATGGDVKNCELKKVTGTTKKRGALQTGSNQYVATFSDQNQTPDSPNNPDVTGVSAATALVASVVTVMFAIVAFVF